jgi:ribonuclease P protein component
MIKLKNLKSNFQFRKLLGQKKIHTDYFSVYFGKNLMKENNNKLNISFIIKKKAGNSVVRNKIKRRLRSAVQKNLKNRKLIDTNYSYLIFGKSKAFSEKYSIISDELEKTFFKINQINN